MGAEEREPGGAPATVNFEARLKRLEEIVDAMTGGELPLDEALGMYEEGVQLVQGARAALERARLKVERLNRETGRLEPLKPSDLAAKSASEAK